MNNKWVSFWFEGNQAWGWVHSSKDWERIKNCYSDYPYVELCNAKRHYSGENDFGFGSSHMGQTTLKDFFEENGMEM